MSAITSLLLSEGIIPEILPLETTLTGRLDICYPDHTLVPGEVINREVIKHQPAIRFVPSEEPPNDDEKFTLFLVDPDDSSSPSSSRTIHWIQHGLAFPQTTPIARTTPLQSTTSIPTASADSATAGVKSSLGVQLGGGADAVGRKIGLMARFTAKPLLSYPENRIRVEGNSHRYIFILALQSPSQPPSPSDFSSFADEEGCLRPRLDVVRYMDEKEMKVVGVSYMYVGGG